MNYYKITDIIFDFDDEDYVNEMVESVTNVDS